jgi:hypothetical protein
MDEMVIFRRQCHSSFIVLYNPLIVLYDFIVMILNYNPIHFFFEKPPLKVSEKPSSKDMILPNTGAVGKSSCRQMGFLLRNPFELLSLPPY